MQPESARSPGESRELRDRLRHVYWIAGGSGSGKSTVARGLAGRHGWHLYSTDDAMPDHARRARPEDTPFLAEFIAMDMDERWLHRSPQTMLETFHWFHGEGFEMIVEDLLGLPERPVVAEGFRLLPTLVHPLLADPRHAVWLLPTPAFREGAFASRGMAPFLQKTADPHRALRNLLDRDRMFTDRLREEATRLSLPIIDVDRSLTEDDLVDRVEQAFDL